jgi:hypothetical protein
MNGVFASVMSGVSIYVLTSICLWASFFFAGKKSDARKKKVMSRGASLHMSGPPSAKVVHVTGTYVSQIEKRDTSMNLVYKPKTGSSR